MPIDVESKLLIVDDLPENLLALEALIRGPARAVYQASSAEQALALLLEHEFALAILDVQMPGMNGFELAEMMRGTERTRHIPIIFVSAAREMNYAFKGYESGAVDFLQKPLDAQMVSSKVSVFVDLYRHRKALKHEIDALAASHRQQEELVQQLQCTQRELERAVRMRDDFMSMVSHELRTPLNTLFLETQVRKLHLSKNNIAPFAPDRLPAMIERDQRQIQNMVRLIDDMLDVTRLRSGALSIRPKLVDLALLARGVVENLAQQAEAVGPPIGFEAPAGVQGMWDEFRIEQVLTNLITNALRYGGGKPIEVSVWLEGGKARMSVRDQGPSIAPEDHQRIFEQFERTDDSRRQAAGLGLGVHRAPDRALAWRRDRTGERSGAGRDLQRLAAVGRGRPARGLMTGHAPGPRPTPAPQERHRYSGGLKFGGDLRVNVLIVDDNQAAADLLQELLTLQDHTACCTYSGQQALDVAARERFDAALVDLTLPDVPGAEVARRLRAGARGEPPLLVAISGFSADEASSAVGLFDHHLQKPIDFDVLDRILARPLAG